MDEHTVTMRLWQEDPARAGRVLAASRELLDLSIGEVSRATRWSESAIEQAELGNVSPEDTIRLHEWYVLLFRVRGASVEMRPTIDELLAPAIRFANELQPLLDLFGADAARAEELGIPKAGFYN